MDADVCGQLGNCMSYLPLVPEYWYNVVVFDGENGGFDEHGNENDERIENEEFDEMD